MDDIRDVYIARVVPGRRFVDIGGLWGVVNEKATVAASAGASEVTMLDAMPDGHPTWTQFDERARAHGVDVRCAVVNLDAAETVSGYGGQFDVVHCSGILYHCPNPIHTLTQLHKLTGERLILTSTIVPEDFETSAGRLTLGIGGMRFVPYLDETTRRIASARWNDVGGTGMLGLDTPVDAWSVTDYGPWWWLLTPSAIRQMVRAVGFDIDDESPFWGGLAHTFLLSKAQPG